MRFLSRRLGILVLLMLFISLFSASVQAQDDMVVVGSGIVEPVLQALIEASEAETAFDVQVTGTSTGFAQFCAGEADMTMAARPMTAQEREACAQNEIVPLELVLGHHILAFIVNPANAETAACLTGEELNTIFAPSSAGEITDWNQVVIVPDEAERLLTPLVPDEDTAEFLVLDALIEGDGIRSDATVTVDAEDAVGGVAESPGAIAVVTLPQAQAAGSDVTIIDVDAAAVQGCQTPSAAAVEDGLYPAAEQLHLYVHAASLGEGNLQSFIEFTIGDEAASVVADAGFVPVTDFATQTNQQNLQAAATGELVVQPSEDFEIPMGLAGQINIGGAGDGQPFLSASATEFNVIAPGVTVNSDFEGLSAGIRRLCNGEVDLIYTYRELTAEELSNCEANTITLVPVNVGTLAPVLLANGESDHLACLTTDALATAWRADSAESIATWNQVDSEFPDQPMTLFAPETGSVINDLLLLTASGESLAMRVDIQFDNDPLYRAAATANVAGGLTVMTWDEYQDVLANNQQNIQLVAVDSGNGCVAPDLNTIRSGEYPLTRSGMLLLNQSQLTRPEVQSLLWLMFSEDNFRAFEQAGYVGVRLNDLQLTRGALLAAFAEAQAAMLEVTPEATAEATAEATEAEAAEESAPEAEEAESPTEEATAETTAEAETE